MVERSPQRAADDRSFLGTGWAFPVQLNSSGGVALVDHEQDIRQSVRVILETNFGERVMRPRFGSSIRNFVFESASTTLLTRLRHRVEEALIRWEPRIDIETVTVTLAEPQRNQVDIEISYRVRATNTHYNLVYPFYLDESRGDAFVDGTLRQRGAQA